MNHKLSVFIGAVLLPIVAACTPDQINSAIEACKGDPECYEIIDDAIEEELEARGITGGRMTNIEMEEFIDILEQYYIEDFPNQTRPSIFDLDQAMWEADTSLLQDINTFFDRSIEFNNYLGLSFINPDRKQLIIKEGIKYVIFKSSANQFTYEILGDSLTRIMYDRQLNALYKDQSGSGYTKMPSFTWEQLYNRALAAVINNPNVTQIDDLYVYILDKNEEGINSSSKEKTVKIYNTITEETFWIRAWSHTFNPDGVWIQNTSFEYGFNPTKITQQGLSRQYLVKEDFNGTFQELKEFVLDSDNAVNWAIVNGSPSAENIQLVENKYQQYVNYFKDEVFEYVINHEILETYGY